MFDLVALAIFNTVRSSHFFGPSPTSHRARLSPGCGHPVSSSPSYDLKKTMNEIAGNRISKPKGKRNYRRSARR